MSEWIRSTSQAAHRALAELEMMDGATAPADCIGRAMACIDVALATTSHSLAAGQCILAAARLIRAAELFSEQPNAPGPLPDGSTPGLEQAGVGAGSEPAAPTPPNAGPSPAPADDLPTARKEMAK